MKSHLMFSHHVALYYMIRSFDQSLSHWDRTAMRRKAFEYALNDD